MKLEEKLASKNGQARIFMVKLAIGARLTLLIKHLCGDKILCITGGEYPPL